MATITVSVKDEVGKEFREAVKERFGRGKGVLGQAITDAMHSWTQEKKQKDIAKEMTLLMEKGFEMGKLKIKSREELYGR